MKFGVVLAAFVYTKGVLGSSNYTVCGNQICDQVTSTTEAYCCAFIITTCCYRYKEWDWWLLAVIFPIGAIFVCLFAAFLCAGFPKLKEYCSKRRTGSSPPPPEPPAPPRINESIYLPTYSTVMAKYDYKPSAPNSNLSEEFPPPYTAVQEAK